MERKEGEKKEEHVPSRSPSRDSLQEKVLGELKMEDKKREEEMLEKEGKMMGKKKQEKIAEYMVSMPRRISICKEMAAGMKEAEEKAGEPLIGIPS